MFFYGRFFVGQKTISSITSALTDEYARTTVEISGKKLDVALADTEAKRTKGLSGVARLNGDEGMLFIFPEQGVYPFWMKDMKFSVDIIWTDRDGKIISINPNIKPETFPATFSPPAPVKYVLEVNAGWAENHKIQTGDVLKLPQ